jgi:hypothetical protein
MHELRKKLISLISMKPLKVTLINPMNTKMLAIAGATAAAATAALGLVWYKRKATPPKEEVKEPAPVPDPTAESELDQHLKYIKNLETRDDTKKSKLDIYLDSTINFNLDLFSDGAENKYALALAEKYAESKKIQALFFTIDPPKGRTVQLPHMVAFLDKLKTINENKPVCFVLDKYSNYTEEFRSQMRDITNSMFYVPDDFQLGAGAIEGMDTSGEFYIKVMIDLGTDRGILDHEDVEEFEETAAYHESLREMETRDDTKKSKAKIYMDSIAFFHDVDIFKPSKETKFILKVIDKCAEHKKLKAIFLTIPEQGDRELPESMIAFLNKLKEINKKKPVALLLLGKKDEFTDVMFKQLCDVTESCIPLPDDFEPGGGHASMGMEQLYYTEAIMKVGVQRGLIDPKEFSEKDNDDIESAAMVGFQ